MTIIDALLLGALQGVTEFLPISSDGHLLVAEHFLGVQQGEGSLSFDIVLHMGSLLAILFCYRTLWLKMLCGCIRNDREMRRLILLLIVATIPGAVLGLLFKDVVETTLRTPFIAGLGFLLTACILLFGEVPRRASGKNPTLVQSFFIGCAQALAILPGLSRSGSTISVARFFGLTREAAVDFSFLMAAPIIAGAGLIPLFDVLRGRDVLPDTSIVFMGFSASLLTSVIAIQLLRLWVRRFSLAWFAAYLIPLGIFLLTR